MSESATGAGGTLDNSKNPISDGSVVEFESSGDSKAALSLSNYYLNNNFEGRGAESDVNS